MSNAMNKNQILYIRLIKIIGDITSIYDSSKQGLRKFLNNK